MKVFVRAKPNAKREKIEEIDATHFRVSVKAPPKDGRANEAIRRMLAEYFKVSISQVQMSYGRTVKEKVFEIS